MKKYLFLLLSLYTVVAGAQITFQKTYDLGVGISIGQTSDNGYILVLAPYFSLDFSDLNIVLINLKSYFYIKIISTIIK